MNILHTNSAAPIPVAARSKAWACGGSLAETPSSNSAGGMGMSLVSVVLYRQRPLRRADPSSRGALLCVCVCVCVCTRARDIVRQ